MEEIIKRLVEIGIDEDLISEENNNITINLMLGLEFIIYDDNEDYRIVVCDRGDWGKDVLLVFKDNINLERFKSAHYAFTGTKLKNK